MSNASTRTSSFLHVAMAVAVLCAIGPGRISAAAPVAVVVQSAPVVVVDRCAGCGLVKAIRHIQATALLPAAYELTVRMRDGSVRTSSASSLDKWVVGDRIILVGGAGPTVR
jgi:hypothetical protein